MDYIFLEAGNLLKLMEVLIVSGIKFIFASPLAYIHGFSFFQTLISTSTGGIVGILFFFFFSGWIIKQYRKYMPKINSCFSLPFFSNCKQPSLETENIKKVKFSKRNRFILKMHKRYGYFGLITFTPILLSIPLGAFIAKRYYSREKHVLVHLSVSIVIWSFVLSTIFTLF